MEVDTFVSKILFHGTMVRKRSFWTLLLYSSNGIVLTAVRDVRETVLTEGRRSSHEGKKKKITGMTNRMNSFGNFRTE